MRIFKANDLMAEGESVGLRSKSDDVGYGEHIHEFIEIIYISDGEGSQFVDGVEYSVKRGDTPSPTRSISSPTPMRQRNSNSK